MADDDLHDHLTASALRAEIDEIDQQVMLMLGLRFRCTDQLSQQLINECDESVPSDGDSQISAMERWKVLRVTRASRPHWQ